MANAITGSRILLSFLMLCFPVYSPAFYVLYLLAGITDMIDGAVARKTNTVSAFGAKLDTVADFVFLAVCFIKLLPVFQLPIRIWVWICMIAAIKIFNVILGLIRNKKLVAEHTVLNKVTGGLLFLLPFTVFVVESVYSGAFVCAVATVAAVQEGVLVGTSKEQ
ncbi:MAG: CDP-alcohol phosphatidyltransferase family protein [Clostridia bacterium]|nr:CDP-alcohol phosphatidyltransferase family protein [Clostridia bacterium]